MSKNNSAIDSNEEGLFTGGATGEMTSTRKDRLLRSLDTYVFAPARVGWHDWRMRVGTAIIVFYVLMGTVGVSLVSEPVLNEGPTYVSWFEDWSMPLGTDRMGQAIGKQVVHATPAMLKMAAAGAVFSAGLAAVVGTVSGYKGGKIDRVLMTVTDIVMTMPALPLIILIAAIYPPRDPFAVGILLAIDSWPGLARAIRSQVLTIREESYIEAARAMGMSSPSVLQKDIIPQLMPYVMINGANAARGVIFQSVALYFLGILPFSTFNWGVMINFAYDAGAISNPGRAGHWIFTPMIVLIVFSFGLILFSQGMDRVFNPQLRARHAKTVGGDEDEDPTDIAQ